MSGDSSRSVDSVSGSRGGCWSTGEEAGDGGTIAFGFTKGVRRRFLLESAGNARRVFGRSPESSFDSVGLCENDVIDKQSQYVQRPMVANANCRNKISEIKLDR